MKKILPRHPITCYFRNMDFDALREIVLARRSIKPALMNGQKIEDTMIHRLLELADWAPTHGHTEPWRFVIFARDAVRQFCADHAALYKAFVDPAKFETAKYEKQLHNGDLASHIIAVYMKRGSNPKISATEELCATAAAVENILLGAAALGLAVLWSTGGVTLQEPMKEYLSLQPDDRVVGLLYVGYSNEVPKTGTRVVPLAAKATWRG